MVTKKGKYGEIKEILYFNKPDRLNTDDMLDIIIPKIEMMGLKHVMIAWSSGYTLYKFLKATKDIKVELDITAVTNPKGGTIGGRNVSIDDETREELEGKGIKVCYLNDDLRLGEPMAPTPEQKYMRDQLLPWMPAHIDPLSLDVGWDTSLLLIISQETFAVLGDRAKLVEFFIKASAGGPFFINVWLHESHTPHVPTKAAMEAPAASIGLLPLSTSSTYTPGVV